MKSIYTHILKAALVIATLSVWSLGANAQQTDIIPPAADTSSIIKKPVYDDMYLDTVQINKKFVINDYDLLGFNFGSQINSFMFSPTKDGNWLFQPVYIGVTWTKYGKLFGFMPYFGFQTGVFYGHEGFSFKPNKTTGVCDDIDGTTQAIMDVVEIPALAQFHVDAAHFKVIANAGIYGGYRMNIERTQYSPNQYANAFKDTDIQLDYGLKGGVGFALMFDPIEFHVMGQVKYGWSSLYEPDYYSKYYYRYAYPFDICITAGVHFQLTKRTGKTKKDLRREAYDSVFKITEP